MTRYALYIMLLCVSGCSSFSLNSSAPETAMYLLHPRADNTTPAITDAVATIVIEKPEIAPGLDTDRIALYRDNGRVLDYYAGGHWPDSLQQTLHAFFKESLQQTFTIREDTQRPEKNEIRYRLRVYARDFQAEYPYAPEGAPYTRTTLNIIFEKERSGQVVDEFIVTESSRASSQHLTAIVGNLEHNLNVALDDMTTKIIAAIK